MAKPTISVIIPTYNSKDKLKKCLHSIENQTYENVEVIVVDSWSNDGTVRLCEEYDAAVVMADVGRSKARNIGSRIAEGDYLIHIDSDMILPPQVLQEVVDLFNQGYSSIILPERNISDSPWGRATDIGKVISNRRNEGNLRAVKSPLYEEVGGHNSDLTAKEDKDLHDRIKAIDDSIGIIDTPILHDIRGRGLIKILRTQFSYSESLDSYYSSAEQAKERGSDGIITYVNRFSHLPRLFIQRPVETILFVMLNVMFIFISQLNKRCIKK